MRRLRPTSPHRRAPANLGVVEPKGAGEAAAGGHRLAMAWRRGRDAEGVVAPARERLVGADATGVYLAGGDAGERARQRHCLAGGVVTPADDRAIAGSDPALVAYATAERG